MVLGGKAYRRRMFFFSAKRSGRRRNQNPLLLTHDQHPYFRRPLSFELQVSSFGFAGVSYIDEFEARTLGP